jgi:feruloyl esterase
MKRLILAAGLAMALGAPGLSRAETACAELKATRLPHAEVTAATLETLGQAQACKISVISRPTADSDIRIEVWIPVGEAWNGKFVQMGNGGFAGQIPSGYLKRLAAQGYAVAGTDNGHQTPVGTSAVWALGHPEKLVDYGWRALKETTEAAKALIAAQKAGGPTRSYFYGCSDGGREALMEAQRFPADFDGIVAGAPANYMSLLFANGAAQQQALARPGAWLGKGQLGALQAAARKQCGGGAYIQDPASCRFDPASVQCRKGDDPETCLSPAQVAAARAIYQGRKDPRTGRIPLPGVTPGAEAEPGSWTAWITGATQARNRDAAGYQFSSNAFKYFAFGDPSYDFLKLDLGAEFARAKARMGPVIDSDSADLTAFKARGGKLIQFHGWNDPAIPARSSTVYAEDLRRTMGDVSGFYRLYLIPGMLHCGGGPGPGNVDWLALLDGWVQGGPAPVEVTARTMAGDKGPSQLLCPYPGVARQDAGGAWACKARGR